eukprot:6127753-Prymnesium_polylepis.1
MGSLLARAYKLDPNATMDQFFPGHHQARPPRERDMKGLEAGDDCVRDPGSNPRPRGGMRCCVLPTEYLVWSGADRYTFACPARPIRASPKCTNACPVAGLAALVAGPCQGCGRSAKHAACMSERSHLHAKRAKAAIGYAERSDAQHFCEPDSILCFAFPARVQYGGRRCRACPSQDVLKTAPPAPFRLVSMYVA